MRTRRRHPVIRAVAAFATLATLTVVAPAPAHAGHQYLQWNDDGASLATFGANAFVTIRTGAIEFSCDSFYPTADIYVVPTGVTQEQQLVDVSGSPNTVFGATGGLFGDSTIGVTTPSGTIKEGTYAVVYDECQDGRVSSEDAVFDPAFRVEIPAELPPIDPRIAELKAAAGTQREHWDLILSSYDAIEEIKAAKEAIDCVLGGLATCAVSMLTDEAKEKLHEAIRAAAGFQDPKDAARDVVLDTISAYRGIEVDPPDAAYESPPSLPPAASLETAGADTLETALRQAAAAADTEGDLAAGLLTALERYRGAAEEHDVAAGGRQAATMATYADLLSDQLATSDAALAGLSSALSADGRPFDSAGGTFSEARDRIAASGFAYVERRTLEELGYDAEEMNALRAYIAHLDFAPGAETALQEAITSWRTGAAGAATALSAFAADMRVLSDELGTSLGVDAGGPYSASVGNALELTAAVTGGDGATVAWDLDRDGAFDDATGASATLNADRAFEGLVGVRATDSYGASAIDYAVVRVGSANSPPVINAETPQGSAIALIGEPTTLGLEATDPDGDPVTVTWTLDGGGSSTGPQYTITPTDADLGLHVVEAVVSDGRPGHAVRITRTLRVLSPDADGDGWRANIDCDDTTRTRSPGNTELVGNGIDDDCDPDTTDDYSPPGNATMHGRATYLHTDAFDNPAQPAVVDLTGNGIEPGDIVRIDFTTVQPFSFYGCGGPFADPYGGGVFSTSAEVLAKTEPHRVPGAVPSGLSPRYTGPTHHNGEATDISEDFALPANNGFVAQVPPGASHAVFGLLDTYFADNCGEVRVTVTPLFDDQRSNVAPVAADDTANTNEDTTLDIPIATLLANDADGDGDPLSVTEVVGGPDAHGRVTVVGDAVRYTPVAGYAGPARFEYTVADALGGTSTAVVDVSVAAVNDPPRARDDAARTDFGVPVRIALAELAANDVDPEGGALTVLGARATADTHGSLSVDGDAVVYTPDSAFSGIGTFEYDVADPSGATAQALVTVQVLPPPRHRPVAVDDLAEGLEGTPVVLPAADLLANDTDADDDQLTVLSVGNATSGDVALAGATVTFTPNAGFTGDATFEYVVGDGRDGTDTGLVAVRIVPANSAPDCQQARATTPLLWSPDHMMYPVDIADVTDADGDRVVVSVTTVTQDEALDTTADGRTEPDATRSGSTVSLRAERQGSGDGRVYRVGFNADDGRGGRCTGTVVIGVPLSRAGADSRPVDSRLVVNSFGG